MMARDYSLVVMVVQVGLQFMVRGCIGRGKTYTQIAVFLFWLLCSAHCLRTLPHLLPCLLLVILQSVVAFTHDTVVLSRYPESYSEKISLYNLMDEKYLAI